jgi:hypothetical protein
MTMRSLGGVVPFNPRAEEGMICGRMIAPTAAEADLLRNSLREELIVFIFSN